jgi:hypothetical protein
MRLTSWRDKSIGVAFPAGALSDSVHMRCGATQVVVDNHSALGMAFNTSRTGEIVAGLDPDGYTLGLVKDKRRVE